MKRLFSVGRGSFLSRRREGPGERSCAKHLLRATHHGDDLEARGGMMKAAMMGAVSFQKGLGACHSLAHPLSSEKGVHHGRANALCLPEVVAFNEGAAHDKLDRVKALFIPASSSCEQMLRELRTGPTATVSLRQTRIWVKK